MALRTIVIDDSILFRKVMRDALGELEGVEVIDIARDGVTAVEKITLHKPDLITLDIEMPGLNGLEVLKELERRGIKTQTLVVSSHTNRGAEVTTQALAMGAFDFILKPQGTNVDESLALLRAELKKRLTVLMAMDRRPGPQTKPIIARSAAVSTNRTTTQAHVTAPTDGSPIPKFPAACKAVFIGISTGGPKALANVIPRLPAGFPVPIIIVQHMPPLFTATMASSLDKASDLNVAEASDGMPMIAGGVYIAPGGKQLGVSTNASGQLIARVNDAPAIKSCKPSVDYLMGSVPADIARRSLALIMTGMGDDGRNGCTTLRSHGATVWAQSEQTCTVYGMPRQVIENGLADSVFDLDALPGLLSQLARKPGNPFPTSVSDARMTTSQSSSAQPLGV